jgi:hypothetical protein
VALESEETAPITCGYQELPDSYDAKLTFEEHILLDLHEVLRRLNEFEREARPLLNAYRKTNGGTIGLAKARRALRNGSQD